MNTKNYNPENNNISLNMGSESVQINGFSQHDEIKMNGLSGPFCKITFPYGKGLKVLYNTVIEHIRDKKDLVITVREN